MYQKQSLKVFYKKAVLKNFAILTPVLKSVFNKVAGFQACNFIKKSLQHRRFPVNIVRKRLLLMFHWVVNVPLCALSIPNLRPLSIYLANTPPLQL